MKPEDITELALLQNPQIRSVDFEHQWYFVAHDVNKVYTGAFNDLPGIMLPIMIKGERELTKCVNFNDLSNWAKKYSGLSSFERHINIALNYNPKKK
jgi:hypothetical protein